MIPVVGGPFQAERRLGKFRLLLPFAVAVRLVAERAAVIAVNPHGAVAVVAVERAAGGIDRDQVVVHAEPVALGIAVGEQPSLQHLVGREADAGHDVGRVEGRLLDLGKIVLRVAVQFQDAHLDQGIVLVEPDLGEVEGVVGTGGRILLRHHLDDTWSSGESRLFSMLSYRSRWWLSRSLPTIASASSSVRFLMPCCVLRWNLTQYRSFLALMRLKVWLPKPCMWR